MGRRKGKEGPSIARGTPAGFQARKSMGMWRISGGDALKMEATVAMFRI
jgi:hypothetical protein